MPRATKQARDFVSKLRKERGNWCKTQPHDPPYTSKTLPCPRHSFTIACTIEGSDGEFMEALSEKKEEEEANAEAEAEK
jgi:hypothetical protein